MEIYRHPKALSCLHIYCKGCVQTLVHGRSKDQEITCPQCRKAVPVAGNNVDNLPTAFFINELIDIYNAMKQAADNVEIACQNCSKKEKAIAFCQSCRETGLFICADCEGHHREMKAFTNHEVVSLKDLKQGSLIHLPLKKKVPTSYSCSEPGHEGKLKKIYCFTCSKLICSDCTLVDHRGHNYDFVNSVATAFKSELSLKVLPIQDAHIVVVQAVSQLEASKQAITEEGKNVKQRIICAFDELKDLLEEHKKRHLREAEKATERKVSTVEKQQSDLRMTKNEYERVLEFVKLTSSSTCDEEIISMKETIEKRLQELVNKTNYIKLTPTETANMIVATPSKEEIEKLIKKQGFIAFLEGSGTGATTDKPSVFEFCLTDTLNRPSHGSLTITAEVQYLTDNEVAVHVPATVSSKVPSFYEVSYTPFERGWHQLTISVCNAKVATFPIFVTHSPRKPVRKIKLDTTWRIALSENGDIYVSQNTYKCYVHLNCDGVIKKVVKSDILARGIDTDSTTGNVYISGDHKLQKYNSDGQLVKEIGDIDTGDQPGEFHDPNDIRFYKNRVYVCDSGNRRVQIFDPELTYIHSFGNKGKEMGQLQWPEDIDFDSKGNAYIVDKKKQCILVFSPTLQFMKYIGKDLLWDCPLSVRVFGDYMYISDAHQGVSIYRKSTRELIHCLPESGTIGNDDQLQGYPVGLSIDKDGYVYVCQHNSRSVLIY